MKTKLFYQSCLPQNFWRYYSLEYYTNQVKYKYINKITIQTNFIKKPENSKFCVCACAVDRKSGNP